MTRGLIIDPLKKLVRFYQTMTETEIKQVMDLIIEKNIFAPNGEDIVSAKEAKIVQTETTEFDLVVA